MDNGINLFKKYLVDEIKAKSFACYSNIWIEVDKFSKTKEFLSAYKKWISLQKGTYKRKDPVEVGDLF